nr:hypothetical protein CFP56_14620 [Quercus suber]
MFGSGNPLLYRPHNMFTAMGHCWVLEDEFSYPINLNLQNSAYVHNTMRQEWAWLFHEQQMFYDELVGYKLPVPRRLASLMPRDTIDELHKALNHIREENNRMKIRLNRYQTQIEIQESVKGGWYEHAQFMQSLLADPIYQSDVEMLDEE